MMTIPTSQNQRVTGQCPELQDRAVHGAAGQGRAVPGTRMKQTDKMPKQSFGWDMGLEEGSLQSRDK